MAQHTHGWTRPMWRPPQPPASTFHTCIGALSCPRGRGFSASWPCADSWGQQMGRRGWEGGGGGLICHPHFLWNFFPSPWAVLRLGPGLTPLRAGDHQRNHPSPQPRSSASISGPLPIQDLDVPGWAVLRVQDPKDLGWVLLEILVSEKAGPRGWSVSRGPACIEKSVVGALAAQGSLRLLSPAGSLPFLLSSCSITPRVQLVLLPAASGHIPPP